MSVYHCVKSFVKSFTSSRNFPSGLFHFSFFSLYLYTILLSSSSSNNWLLTSVYQSFVGSIIVIANQKIPGNEDIYLSGRLNVLGSCLALPPSPQQLWDMDLPDPAREPAWICMYHAGNRLDLWHWSSSILHQLSSRSNSRPLEPNSSNHN